MSCDQDEPLTYICEETLCNHWIILPSLRNQSINNDFLEIKSYFQNVTDLTVEQIESVIRLLKRNSKGFPIDLYVEDGKVQECKMNCEAPDDKSILNTLENTLKGKKVLFVIDHIMQDKTAIITLSKNLEKLISTIDARVLMVCHDDTHYAIQSLHQYELVSLIPKEFRVENINKKVVWNILLAKTRRIYDWDFQDLSQSELDDIHKADINKENPSLFDWLARSPSLISSCAKVLDKMVPLHIIFKMYQEDPAKQKEALKQWQNSSLCKTEDAFRDGESALDSFFAQLKQARKLWEIQDKEWNKKT